MKSRTVTGWLRPVFLFFDILFWMLGCLLLIFIFWLIGTNPTLRLNFLIGTSYFTYVVLPVGLFIFFVGIFGFVAGLIEGSCLLKTYIAFMILLICAEIGGAVAASAVGSRASSFRAAVWEDFNTPVKDHIQLAFKCCGFSSYFDYSATITLLPTSCFVANQEKTAAYLYTSSCWREIRGWLESPEGIASWVFTIIGIAVLELLCLVFAILMLVKILRASKVASTPKKKPRPTITQKATVGPTKKPKAAVVRNNNVHAAPKPVKEPVKQPERVKTPVKAQTPVQQKPMSTKAEQGTRKEERGYVAYAAPKPVHQPAPAPPEPEPEPTFRAKKIPNNNIAPVNDSPSYGYDTAFLRQYKPVRY